MFSPTPTYFNSIELEHGAVSGIEEIRKAVQDNQLDSIIFRPFLVIWSFDDIAKKTTWGASCRFFSALLGVA